jgi:hypothetical protein
MNMDIRYAVLLGAIGGSLLTLLVGWPIFLFSLAWLGTEAGVFFYVYKRIFP